MGLQGYFDNCVNPILCLVLYWFYSLVSFFSRSVEGGVGRILLFQWCGACPSFPNRWRGEWDVYCFSRSVEGGEGGVSTSAGDAASVGYDVA